MRKIKENYYISIFLLLASLLFGQMVRIPIAGKIILVSDIAVVLFLIYFLIRHPEEKIKSKIIRQPANQKSKIRNNYLFIPASSFVFFSILSLLFAIPSLGLAKVLTAGLYLFRWILYASVVFVIASLPDKEKAERTIFWGIIGMGFLLSIAGFIQLKIHPDFADMVKFGWDPHKNRLLSTWFDPNLLAGYFIIALALLSANLIFILQKSFLRNKDTRKQDTNKTQNPNNKLQINLKSQIHKFKTFIISNLNIWNLFGACPPAGELKFEIYLYPCILYLVSCALYLAFILTYSRSGYLALFIVFATICALNFNWKFFIAGLIIAPLTLAIFPRSYSRVSDAAQIDVTSQMRIDSWQDGWDVIKNNPILGVGFNALQWRREGGCTEHASSGFDSSLLTIWAAAGIFGLASYLWIILEILKNKYKTFKSADSGLEEKNTYLNRYFQKIFALGSIAAIIGLLIHSCFVNSLLYPHMLLVFWLISI